MPVGGVCSGDGTCEDGGTPVNGQCGVTCQDGTFHADGHCPPTYYPCPDGSQPVNGQCPVGPCNPATDPNHCDQGYASGGGDCAAAPSCNGDQIACSVLFQSWKTRCNLEGTHGPPDFVEHSPSEVSATETVDPSMLDTSGFLPSDCPSFGSIEVLDGVTWDLGSDYCTLLQAIAGLVLFAATFISLRILAGAHK
jgi:hypothetical protein